MIFRSIANIIRRTKMVARENLMFENEIDAAEKLLEILPADLRKNDKFLLIASSLESIVLVNLLAKKLEIGYEFLFTESIYAPNNPECVIACVSETQEIVMVEELVQSFGISLEYIYGQGNRRYEEKILKNVYKYRKGELLQNLENKNVILVDEGCHSGITALACIKTLVNLKAKTITYATPLIASDAAEDLAVLVDEIYTVCKIADFVDVDFYYKNKSEITPENIMQMLNNCSFYLPFHTEKNKEKTNAVQN